MIDDRNETEVQAELKVIVLPFGSLGVVTARAPEGNMEIGSGVLVSHKAVLFDRIYLTRQDMEALREFMNGAMPPTQS